MKHLNKNQLKMLYGSFFFTPFWVIETWENRLSKEEENKKDEIIKIINLFIILKKL